MVNQYSAQVNGQGEWEASVDEGSTFDVRLRVNGTCLARFGRPVAINEARISHNLINDAGEDKPRPKAIPDDESTTALM
jgi:hypothetical protein